MDVLVSDTSVVIDLERARLIDALFLLPHRVMVPDRLFEQELRRYGGDRLVELGLIVRSLTGDEVERAQLLRARERRISIHDSYALAVAITESALLVSGDAALRRLAQTERVRCHGVLWVFDELEAHNAVSRDCLRAGLASLASLAAHPRARLPAREVGERLRRYAGPPDFVREDRGEWRVTHFYRRHASRKRTVVLRGYSARNATTGSMRTANNSLAGRA